MDQTLQYPELLWAGTEISLACALQAHALILQAGPYDGPQEEDLPYNYERVGNVGVVKIRGSLVNNDSPYNRYFGAMSYNEIRAALVAAVDDQEVGAILLDISSGGGAVSGVADTADFIAGIDKSLKPVYAFSDGDMASAAYWLGVSGRAVYNSRTSVLGSIGVITTHTDVSKMRASMGIKDTVLRAGEFKALANPYEPLSEEGRKQIMDMIGATYGVFVGHVAAQLGTSVEHADATYAQGRTFVGQKAVDIGLSKGVRTFESVLAQLQTHSVDTLAAKAHTRSALNPHAHMKTTLNVTQLAALAAGAAIGTLGELTAEQKAEVEKIVADRAEAERKAAEEKAAKVKAEEEARLAAQASNDKVVSYLQGQLTTAQAEVVTLKQAAEQAAAKATSLEAVHTQLLAIAVASLSHMRVALGGSATDGKGMTPEAVLAEHAEKTKTFNEKFPGGRVAATSDETNKQVDTAFRRARMAATSLTKRS